MDPSVEDIQLAIRILGRHASGIQTDRAARLIAEYREQLRLRGVKLAGPRYPAKENDE